MLLFNLLVLPSFLMCYAQCCHGDGSGVKHVHMKYHGHSLYYQATVLAIALRLFTIYCCHGDGTGIMAIRTIIRLLRWK